MPRQFANVGNLDADDRKFLVLLGAAFFFGHYDMTILTLALADVQASFAIPEQDLGKMIAVIRLGALPGVALALMADHFGRRRMLLVTLIGMSVCSIATSYAQSANQYMAFQSGVRLFGTLEEIIAITYALEMLPTRHRGWGIGFLGAMGGMGAGLGSVLYGAVDVLPGGWRAMYAVGGVAILIVAWLRRSLPESPLFEQQAQTQVATSWWEPLREIFTHHRRAIVALGVFAFAFWFQVSAGLSFMSKFLQSHHGYSVAQVSLLFVVAGTIAILGNVAAGRLSDVIGRRPVLALAIVLNCVAFMAFYNLSGPWIPLAWIVALLSFFVVDVISYALSGESFPTSCRSTAGMLRIMVTVLAAAVGLTTEGYLYEFLGSHAAAISLMTLSSLLALPVIALWLGETANTELR